MEKVNLSEFRTELEKMDLEDLECGLWLAEKMLSELFDKETDNHKKLELAIAIYSIRSSKPKENIK